MLHAETTTPQQTIAVIDLGSNTARLIIMAAIPGFAFKLEDEIREVVRLREGLSDEGLTDAAVARGFSTLKMFKAFCDNLTVDQIIATATSAVRDAPNGHDFVRRVQDDIGLTLRVLDGETEAHYGVLGALNEVPVTTGYVVDVGGGSAQISEIRDRQFYRGASFPLGALALTERFITTDPISDREYSAIYDEINHQLDAVE